MHRAVHRAHHRAHPEAALPLGLDGGLGRRDLAGLPGLLHGRGDLAEAGHVRRGLRRVGGDLRLGLGQGRLHLADEQGLLAGGGLQVLQGRLGLGTGGLGRRQGRLLLVLQHRQVGQRILVGLELLGGVVGLHVEQRLLDRGVLHRLRGEHLQRAGRRRVHERLDDHGVARAGGLFDAEADVVEGRVRIGQRGVGGGHPGLGRAEELELAGDLGMQLTQRGVDSARTEAVEAHHGALARSLVVAGLVLLLGRYLRRGPGSGRQRDECDRHYGRGCPTDDLPADAQHPSPWPSRSDVDQEP